MLALWLRLYPIALVSFLVIHMLWLGVVARGFYKTHLGYLLSERPNWAVAIVFYLLFIGGLLTFVVVPALEANSWRKLVFLGAAFGLVTYATYDLTNHATVKGWPWIVTVVDLLWGIVLSTSVSAVTFQAGRWLR